MPDAVLPAGQRALIAEFGTLAEVMAFHAHVKASPLAGQTEAVAAARTVLLTFRSRRETVSAAKQIRRLRPRPPRAEKAREVQVRVHYDGEDLEALAEQLSITREALISWHIRTVWVGAFGGLAPGFAHCVPEELVRRKRPRKSELLAGGAEVPRRASPRTRVPAGAVALAGEFSAVHPRSSSGSWQLIGTSDAPLWDLTRSGQEGPALIRPGDRVRYVPVTERIEVAEPASPASGEVRDPVMEVITPGAQALVQDVGRRGCAELGAPRSGAADVAALRQANQLVGNDDGAAAFEVLFGGFELEVRQTCVLAVTGAEADLEVSAPAPQDRSNMAFSGTGAISLEEVWESREVPQRAPFWMYAGERLSIAAPTAGMRSYVAVSGGLEAPRVLGSRSTDTLSGLGPPAVKAGDRFALDGVTSRFVGIADVARTPLPGAGPVVLRFVPGPREAWFGDADRPRRRNPGVEALQRQRWTVSRDVDRVGARLVPEDGEPLEVTAEGRLPSEPVVRGAIQVPPNGEPVLFLADHPVTRSCPVIGVVVREDLGLAGQLPPGTSAVFQAVDPETLQPV
ncbi:carboxyltransferase domain-containing protein [Nesterenkonia populi]|uniref:5-oxoprolinase subunit B/C family protein n=1 Tax=Nesterenkonia populi TaxID=1591087 RepID=UPI0011BE03E9|nr:carboxyltransferase domain-containing protein [Nesterenkonia populi]